jgi:hypothetical protein
MLTDSRTISRTWRFLLILLISIIGIASIIGSGGSGATAPAAPPSDTAPPVAAITFPPPVSSTNGMTLTVTGTASDATGVAMVEVNGVAATSTDDFATWRAVVSITAGANTLTVATADALGISDPAAATVTVNVDSDLTGYGTDFVDGYAVALASNFAFVTDFSSDALVSIDTTTGNSVIVSDGMIGTGSAFDGPGGTVLVNGNTAALVTNWRTVSGPILGELLSVDLVSGVRTVVSDGTADMGPVTGTGPILFGPIGIALIDATMALVTNNASDEVLSVNLTNGNRAVFSADGTRGAGLPFSAPEGIAIDTTNDHDRALVTDSDNNSLVAVALLNGDRTIISDAATGTGPNFNFPIGVVVDSANNRALVASSFSNLILAVDLETGNRTIFSTAFDAGDPMAMPPVLPTNAVGTGPALTDVSGIALDGQDSAFVSGQKLWAIELGSGDRVIVGD